MKKSLPPAIGVLFLSLTLISQGGLSSFEPTPAWQQQIRDLAPAKAPAQPKAGRKILVFSLATGFQHWCIPHTEAMVGILGEKSGAFQIVPSTDIEQFQPENLRQYDAVLMNNNCPDRKDRDVFRDVLINKVDTYGAFYKDRPLAEREALARRLFESLVTYVAEGGGLILLHGGITNFNNADVFSDLVGGSFDFHPAQQDVVLQPVAPEHPLLQPFNGKPFVHVDEPYIFNRAYAKLNFRPLLEMDTAKLAAGKKGEAIGKLPRYVSWIKRHGRGRVFYCAPSHNAQSFEQPALLQFILGGIQYALGDFPCPDAPVEP